MGYNSNNATGPVKVNFMTGFCLSWYMLPRPLKERGPA
jgi:hypothetical protein